MLLSYIRGYASGIIFFLLAFPSNGSDVFNFDGPWPEGKQRPHVVFDIDSTLCVKIPEGLTKRALVHQKEPETVLIPYLHRDNAIFTHAFFPGIGELLLTILNWGWNIDFYSSGIKERNEAVIPLMLKESLRLYVPDPNSILAMLIKDRIRIFSKDKMRRGDEDSKFGFEFYLTCMGDKLHPIEQAELEGLPTITKIISGDGRFSYEIKAWVEEEIVKSEEEDPSGSPGVIVKSRSFKPVLKKFIVPEDKNHNIHALFYLQPFLEGSVFISENEKWLKSLLKQRGIVKRCPLYQEFGDLKKDLRDLGVPLKDIILVEDDRSYAVGGEQYPPICVSWGDASHFKEWVALDLEGVVKQEVDATCNAPFLLGILYECKKLVADGVPLRSALRHVRAIPKELLNNRVESKYDTAECPWSYTTPSSVRYSDDKFKYEMEKVGQFLASGKQQLEVIKQQRISKIQSQTSNDPYMDLIMSTFERTDFVEGEDGGCVVM